MNDHLRMHGDGVKDIAFRVDDAAAAWEYTTSKGAKSAPGIAGRRLHRSVTDPTAS